MPAWTGGGRWGFVHASGINRSAVHFRTVHIEGLYTIPGNAVLPQQVVAYDEESRIFPADGMHRI
jgi:hypothetical protein